MLHIPDWPHADSPPPFGGDAVHVWLAGLDLADDTLNHLRETLSEDERRRAGRFYFERDRRRYTAGRGLLRRILGAYAGLPPAGLRFGYNVHGKPYLPDEGGPQGLSFNLSHSHGLALLALARGREVGVDLEHVNEGRPLAGLAEHFFSPREVEALRALADAEKAAGFYACWSRKEAYIKARGRGLSLALDSFDVTLAPGEPAALLATRDDPAEAGQWSLRALPPIPGFAAAVAARGHAWQLWCGHWPERP